MFSPRPDQMTQGGWAYRPQIRSYYNPRNPRGVVGGGYWNPYAAYGNAPRSGYSQYRPFSGSAVVYVNPDGTLVSGTAPVSSSPAAPTYGGGGGDNFYRPGVGVQGGTRGWGYVPGRDNMDPMYTDSWAVAMGLAAPSWRGGGQVEHGISAYIPGVSPEPGTMGDRPPIGEPRRRVAADLNPNPWKAYQANRKRRFQDKYGVKPGQGSGVTSMGVGGMASWNP